MRNLGNVQENINLFEWKRSFINLLVENVFMVGAGNPITSGDYDAEDWLKRSKYKPSRDSARARGIFMIWRMHLLRHEVRSRVLRVIVDHFSLAKCRCKRNVIFYKLTKNSNACIFYPLHYAAIVAIREWNYKKVNGYILLIFDHILFLLVFTDVKMHIFKQKIYICTLVVQNTGPK